MIEISAQELKRLRSKNMRSETKRYDYRAIWLQLDNSNCKVAIHEPHRGPVIPGHVAMGLDIGACRPNSNHKYVYKSSSLSMVSTSVWDCPV